MSDLMFNKLGKVDFSTREKNDTAKTADNNLRNGSLQDCFLSICIREELTIDLCLNNESSRRGYILAFDNLSILFWDQKRYYLIFKSSICLISPLDFLDMHFCMKEFSPAKEAPTTEKYPWETLKKRTVK